MLRSLGGATERSLGARRLRISVSLPLPPDLGPSFLLQLDPLLPADTKDETMITLRCSAGIIFYFSLEVLKSSSRPSASK